MRHITKRIGLGLVAPIVVLSASTLAAQGSPFQVRYSLPPGVNIHNSTTALSRNALTAAIGSALNSDGDSLSLQLELEAGAGAVLNIKGMGSLEVKLDKADGGIDLSFAEKSGVSLGAEVTKRIGVKVPIQGERKLVMHFDRPEDLQRALQATAVLGIGVPAMIAERTRLSQLIDSAVNSIRSLEQSVASWNQFRRGLHRDVTALRARITVARRAYFAALRQAEAMLRRAARASWFFRPVLRVAARALYASAHICNWVLECIDRHLDRELARLDRCLRQIEAQNLRIARECRFVEGCREQYFKVRAWTKACAQETEWLLSCFKGVEFGFHCGGSLEAKLEIPGVSLANNVGFGGALAQNQHVVLAIQVPGKNRDFSLKLEIESEMELEGEAAALAGGKAGIKGVCKRDLSFVLDGSAWRQIQSETSIGIELAANYALGLGVAYEDGVGIELMMVFDNDENVGEIIAAACEMFRGNTNKALGSLGNIAMTFTSQGYRQRAWVGAVGIDLTSGNGGLIGGAATWQDKGVKHEQPASFKDAWTAIHGQTRKISGYLGSVVN